MKYGERVVAVVNPRAGGGAASGRLAALGRTLGQHFPRWEVRLTAGPGHATELARAAVAEGATAVLSVGGDGTHHEVVQALMDPAAEGVALGVLHAGTGGDFRRNVPTASWSEAVAAMASRPARVIDVGHAAFRTDAGDAATEWFLNVASAGLSGSVDRAVNAGSKVFGGTVSFALGTLKALRSHRAARVKLTVDGRVVHDGPAHLVLACNGKWAGGGMMFAPEARLDDGLLDVVMLRGDRIGSVLGAMPSVYRGQHVKHPDILLDRGRVVEVSTEDFAPIDLDGESPGRAPVTFTVHPARLALLGAG